MDGLHVCLLLNCILLADVEHCWRAGPIQLMYGNKMIGVEGTTLHVVCCISIHERAGSLHERVDRRRERACMNQVTACMMGKPASCSTGDPAVSTNAFIWKYVEHYGIGCTAVR